MTARPQQPPLTRPGSRYCNGCHRFRPIGQFGGLVTLDGSPNRMTHVQHDRCRDCRATRGIAPGRAFR